MTGIDVIFAALEK